MIKRKNSSKYVLKKTQSGEKRWMLRDRAQHALNRAEDSTSEVATIGGLAGGGLLARKLYQDYADTKLAKKFIQSPGQGDVPLKTMRETVKSIRRAQGRLMPYGSMDIQSIHDPSKAINRGATAISASKNPFTRNNLSLAGGAAISAVGTIGASKRLERAGKNKDYSDEDIVKIMQQETANIGAANTIHSAVAAGTKMAMESSLLQDRLPEKKIIESADSLGSRGLVSNRSRGNAYTKNKSVFERIRKEVNAIANSPDNLRGIDNPGFSKSMSGVKRKGANTVNPFNLSMNQAGTKRYRMIRRGVMAKIDDDFLRKQGARIHHFTEHANAEMAAKRSPSVFRPDPMILGMKKKVAQKELRRMNPMGYFTDVMSIAGGNAGPDELHKSLGDVQGKLTRSGVTDSPIHAAAQFLEDSLDKSSNAKNKYVKNLDEGLRKIGRKAMSRRPKSFRGLGSQKVASEILAEMLADTGKRVTLKDVGAGVASYLKKDATDLVEKHGMDSVLRGRSTLKAVIPLLAGSAAGIAYYRNASRKQEQRLNKEVMEKRRAKQLQEDILKKYSKVKF